jgi:muramidase (phage lysozyme)
MADRQFYEQFAKTPEGRGLLRAIRFAEGTGQTDKAYTTLFGGGQFSDLSRHPERVINTPNYSSAAAGAYQFMPGTWEGVSKQLGLKGFSPREQDVGALAKARERLMSLGGLAVLKEEGLSNRVLAALAPEWASLPTLSGASYYGQPVKSAKDIQKVYSQYAAAAPSVVQRVQTPAAVQAPAASQAPASSGSNKADLFRNTMKLIQGVFGSVAPGGSSSKSDQYFDLAMAYDATGDEETAAQLYEAALGSDMVPATTSRASNLLSSVLPMILESTLTDLQQTGDKTATANPPAASSPKRPELSQMVGRVGSVIDPSKDVFETTGPHLDARVIKGGTGYVNPETWRTGLTQLYIGGKPLYAKNGTEFVRNYEISSGFGPRPVPVAGASTNHLGIDIPAEIGTSLEWRGPGKLVKGKGFVDIDTTDERGNPYTVRLLHMTPD